MKKYIASVLLILMGSVLFAEITSLYTFPGGSDGDIQINEGGVFGGRTLIPGTNTTISTTSTTIAINSSGGGGSGTPSLPFESVQLNGGGIFVGTGTLTMNTTSNFLSIGATTTFTSVSTTTWTNVSSVTFGNGSALIMSTSTNLQLPSGQVLNNASSVTVQGVMTAGSNITLTPTAGVLTIASTGGGSGSTIYNATSTAGFPFGASFSTASITSDSSTVPTIRRSADATGLSFDANGIYLWDSGTRVATFVGTQSNIVGSLRLDETATNSSTIGNLYQFWLPGTDSVSNFGNQIQRQKQNGDLHGFTYGIRDAVGEDPYFNIEPINGADGVLRTTGTFHVNVSTFGSRMGFVGIHVSTPMAMLSVGGHIQIATNTATNPAVSSCGTGPSIIGHDTAGKVTIGTGGVATSCTVTFGTAFTNAPACILNGSSSLFTTPSLATTTTGFVATVSSPFTASTVYTYICIGWE